MELFEQLNHFIDFIEFLFVGTIIIQILALVKLLLIQKTKKCMHVEEEIEDHAQEKYFIEVAPEEPNTHAPVEEEHTIAREAE